MSKYENSTIGGTRTRTEKITIELPIGKLPIIRVQEQEVVLLENGNEVPKVGGARTFSFTFDPTKQYAERNSETDELTGEVKVSSALFNDVYGYIRQAQTDKDNEVVVNRANQ